MSPGHLVNTKLLTMKLCRGAGAGHQEGVFVQRNIVKAFINARRGIILCPVDNDSDALLDLPG